MPASLLESQLATLEPAEPDESVLVLDVSLAPDALVAAAVEGLGLPRSGPGWGAPGPRIPLRFGGMLG